MSSKKNDGPINKAKNKPDVYDAGDLNVANADERKTVILDSELEGLEFDDKVWLFWKRNKTLVITLVAAVFISAAVSGIWRTFTENSKNMLAGEYAMASTPEGRAAFASANSGTNLAGVALLVNADDFFTGGKFAEAAVAYGTAADYLSGTPLWGRALLGKGISLVKSGKADEGMVALVALSDNAEAGVFAAEASFHVAMEDLAKGNAAAAKARFEKLAENPSAGEWAEVARSNLARLASR
jgi:Uncharacterized protein conserved in bacteria